MADEKSEEEKAAEAKAAEQKALEEKAAKTKKKVKDGTKVNLTERVEVTFKKDYPKAGKREGDKMLVHPDNVRVLKSTGFIN